MKNVIILSDFGLDQCCACASINLALFDKFQINYFFVPEDQLIYLPDEVYDSHIVVAIGYKNLYLKQEMLMALRNKLLFLGVPGDEVREDEGKYIPILFPPEININSGEISGFHREIVDLMATIIEAVDNNKTLDESLGLNPEEIAEIEEVLGEDSDYQCERYEQALKVVAALDGTEGLIKFHGLFLKEMISMQENSWINEMINKYEIMDINTKHLIPKIKPLLHMPGIAFVKTDNRFFFESDIFEACEKLKYFSLAIEYIMDNGEYETIVMEKCADEMIYLKGTIEENFNDVIANYN